MPSELIKDYMRLEHLPHIWCPGCGNGTLTRDVLLAIDALIKDPASPITRNNVIVVSGIGCSSRAVGYMDFDTIHTTHGRALAFATGIKFAKPELNVIVVTGDGDCSAIGGNHLIHAARRNVDMTVICFNNSIYGMTGGQYSPTTPVNDKAATAPYGVIDRPFDIVQLAQGSGASFTARGDVYHAAETTRIIRKAIEHKGFSVVDCRTICPTNYGRKNRKGDAVEMLKWQKEHGVSQELYDKMSEEQRRDKYVIGVLSDESIPEYTELYREIMEKAQKKGSENGRQI